MVRLREASFVVALLVGVAAVTSAQTSGQALLDPARAGDKVTVTTASGAQFSGRLVADADGTLVIRGPEGERTVAHGDVNRVTRRSNRFLFGPLIGVAAGLALGLPLKTRWDNEGANGDAWVALTVGIGVAVGSAIDLTNGRDKTIYARTAPVKSGVEFQPRRRGGLVAWRVNW